MKGGQLDRYQDGIPIHKGSKPDRYCVLANLLIPGKGDPVKDGCLVVEGSKITFAGKASHLEQQDEDLPKTHVKVSLDIDTQCCRL